MAKGSTQGRRIAKTQSFRAKLFRNGGSQAIRLPKDCRFGGDEVLVHKNGNQLTIEPVDLGWSREFLALFVGPPSKTFPPRAQRAQREREAL